MSPRGAWKAFGPIVAMVGRRNLRLTASALKDWLERPDAGD
jgi:hypothetical protein